MKDVRQWMGEGWPEKVFITKTFSLVLYVSGTTNVLHPELLGVFLYVMIYKTYKTTNF